jgi:hypothetical protein
MAQPKYWLFIFPLYLLHIFLGLNGLTGGTLLIIKTDGSLLGMQPDWLSHSPFNDYLIPGILLSLLLGVLPLLTVTGLIKRNSFRWGQIFNIYKNRYWAWSFSLYTGIISIFWIAVQLLLTQYFWIQPVIMLIGLFIIIFTMLPPVMKHFEVD